MEIIVKPFHALPCELETFTINGTRADTEDFGSTNVGGDCMNNICHCSFKPSLPKEEILKKYNITVDEYAEICRELEENLEVQSCGWCS